jgi:MFS family permease
MAGIVSGISLGLSAVAFVPVGIMAMKLGRKKTVIIGFALAAVAFILSFFFASASSGSSMLAPALFTVFYLLASFGMIIANVNTLPMVVELSTDKTVGKYTGYYYIASMSAQAATPFLAGLLMDSAGSKFLFLYSFAFVCVAAILMFFVKHGDSKPLPKAKV